MGRKRDEVKSYKGEDAVSDMISSKIGEATAVRMPCRAWSCCSFLAAYLNLSGGVSLQERAEGCFVANPFEAPRDATFGHHKRPVAKLDELFQL